MNWAQKFFSLVLVSFTVFATESSWGVTQCLDNNGQNLNVMNDQVIRMKTSTPNSYKTRALISGMVTKIYSDATCHHHFQLKIGNSPLDTIEVIYNEEFGKFPSFGVGATVEACGDYITSNKQTQYPASPDGAIIHWVHVSPRPQQHPSGFLIINGIVTGQSIGQSNQCHGE